MLKAPHNIYLHLKTHVQVRKDMLGRDTSDIHKSLDHFKQMDLDTCHTEATKTLARTKLWALIQCFERVLAKAFVESQDIRQTRDSTKHTLKTAHNAD